jgi:hypothetical protein
MTPEGWSEKRNKVYNDKDWNQLALCNHVNFEADEIYTMT